MSTITAMLDRGRLQLHQTESPQIDAQTLLAHVLQKDRSFFYAHPEHKPSAEQIATYDVLIAKRKTGIPIAHLTGQREFWSLNLRVSAATLIPRPETEHLVELAINKMHSVSSMQILDMGTGTGAIAIALAKECRDQHLNHQIIATDTSPDALQIAQENMTQHACDQITLLQSDWFSALAQKKFDLIVSNPPYIAESHPSLAEGDVRFEPRLALTSGSDGLDDIRKIIQHAPEHLLPKGWLLLEHGYDQAQIVRALFQQQRFSNIRSQQDFAGHDRITLGQWIG